jgi:hypothetical protein
LVVGDHSRHSGLGCFSRSGRHSASAILHETCEGSCEQRSRGTVRYESCHTVCVVAQVHRLHVYVSESLFWVVRIGKSRRAESLEPYHLLSRHGQ